MIPEIERYNRVTRKNHEIPWYDATKAERKIELYYGKDGELVILGWAGESYVYWMSVTQTEDRELNARIYHHIADETLVYVTRFAKIEEEASLSGIRLKECYKAELKWKKEPRRKNEILANWETPFGTDYRKEDSERNGQKFAGDVENYYCVLKQCCKWRDCDGVYAGILEKYAVELENTEEYTERTGALQKILEAESYLLLSDNTELRKLYNRCRFRCRELQMV